MNLRIILYTKTITYLLIISSFIWTSSWSCFAMESNTRKGIPSKCIADLSDYDFQTARHIIKVLVSIEYLCIDYLEADKKWQGILNFTPWCNATWKFSDKTIAKNLYSLMSS